MENILRFLQLQEISNKVMSSFENFERRCFCTSYRRALNAIDNKWRTTETCIPLLFKMRSILFIADRHIPPDMIYISLTACHWFVRLDHNWSSWWVPVRVYESVDLWTHQDATGTSISHTVTDKSKASSLCVCNGAGWVSQSQLKQCNLITTTGNSRAFLWSHQLCKDRATGSVLASVKCLISLVNHNYSDTFGCTW